MVKAKLDQKNTEILVKRAADAYYDYDSEDKLDRNYVINDILYTHKELLPFKDNFEQFIVYTCFICRNDVDISILTIIINNMKDIDYKNWCKDKENYNRRANCE
jgi:hypothetical protein